MWCESQYNGRVTSGGNRTEGHGPDLLQLGQNNPIAGFVNILPSAELYLTQHFLDLTLYLIILYYFKYIFLN